MAEYVEILDVSNFSLDELKQYRYEQIDRKTFELINNGFVYNGHTFSLSDNAQKNLLGVYTAKELLTYPFPWNTKNDDFTYEIQDIAEMSTFFMTALGTKKAQQDSGTAIKIQVRGCITIEEVNAIIDNR